MANIFTIPLNSQVLVFEGIEIKAAEYIAKQVQELRYRNPGDAILVIVLNDDRSISRSLVARTDNIGKLVARFENNGGLK